MILLIIILLVVFYFNDRGSVQLPILIDKAISSPPSLRFKKPLNPENVRCTMDVKCCPDGSCVGRVAPSCSFAPCPEDKRVK